MPKDSAPKNGMVLPGTTAFQQWPPEERVDTPNEKVVVTSALSRPLVLPRHTSEPSPPALAPAPPSVASAPATPSGVVSYEDALAAVFAQAGLTDEPAPPPTTVEPGATFTRTCTPEEIVAFLSALPRHLSPESRFERVEEELRKYPNTDPNDLVGDAAAQLVALRTDLLQHNAEQEVSLQATRSRIELLELELERMRAQLAERESRGQERRQELLTRVDEMTGVIVFFDSYQSYLVRRAEETHESVPQFVDEETALRLLERREES